MSKYRYTGRAPGVLADGRPVAPGQDVFITADDLKEPDNRLLIDDGVLIEVPAAKTKTEVSK